MDLVVRGGRVVTSSEQFVADVGIADGRIVQLGGEMQGEQVLDAHGKLVLPGGVDMHVHFTRAFVDEGDFEWADDFESGSRAAVAGGVTTVGNITFPERGEDLLDALSRIEQSAERASCADFVLHPVILHPPADAEQLAGELAGAGCVSIKFFTHMTGFVQDPVGYLSLLRAAASHGLMSMVHCEDGALNAFLTGLCSNESAPLGTDAVYCPADSIESAAVRRVTAFAEAAAAPVYLVHLASASSLDAALEARGRGVAVAVETRPEYLLLSDVELAQASGSAPGGATTARGDHDLERLWSAIERGELDTVCTDHAPWAVVPDRQPSSSMRSARSGLGCLEWARSLLYSRGVLAGKISLERLVAVTSTNPARLFGLYPGKGTIAPGGDADLAIFDPGASWAVSQDRQSRASWSALGGWALTGRTTETIRRGEVVFRLADGFFATGGGRRQASR